MISVITRTTMVISLFNLFFLGYKRLTGRLFSPGTPRTFNEAGATYYNVRFNGEAGERATFNNDVYGDSIPAGPNYYHAGTAFYYYGTNMTNVPQPNWNICWDDNNDNPDDPACQAQPQPGLNTTSAEGKPVFN